MAFEPNVNWVNDAPPGFEADEMVRMQLGIADAHQIGEGAAQDAAEALQAAQGAIQSPTVRRVVTSTDPDEPLSEGDLLLVHEPVTQFYTDFTEHPTGASPNGWSDRWVPVTATVASVPVATGNKALRLTLSAATARVFYSWDTIGSAENVELVGCYRVTGGGNSTGFVLPGLCVRGSGIEGEEQGYRGFRYHYQSLPRMSVQGYENGSEGDYSQSWITTDEVDPFTNSVWQWVRVRIYSNVVYAKAWNNGEAEPVNWQTSHAANNLTSGLVGISMLNACTVEWDCIGVGLNGHPAPMAPVA